MSDVTGPISTLPGASHHVPDGTMCDYHPERPAVARIQGETDSFGCEMEDLCAQCVDAHRQEVKNADKSGTCDWCGSHVDRLRDARDYDEGMCGRVYQVCQPCITRRDQRIEEELERYYHEYDYGDEDE